MVEVDGFCDERFAPIGDAFRAGFERGSDLGASLAVTMNGEVVVDLWGGYRDLAHTQPWETDTVVPVYSTSKIVVAMAALMVWDRGLIDLDEPIATYWPKFAQNGKAAITTRQMLVYTSGVPGFGRVLTVDDVRDWDRMIEMVERAAVWYEPGTITCYSPSAFGYILGELVRRVSGVEFVRFVAQEITGPLGADFHFALSTPHDIARVAEQRHEGVAWEAQSPMGAEVDAEAAQLMEPLINGDLLGIVIPATSGVTNALGTGSRRFHHGVGRRGRWPPLLEPDQLRRGHSRAQLCRGSDEWLAAPGPVLRSGQSRVPRADADVDPLGRVRRIMADHGPRVGDRLRVHPESFPRRRRMAHPAGRTMASTHRRARPVQLNSVGTCGHVAHRRRDLSRPRQALPQ